MQSLVRDTSCINNACCWATTWNLTGREEVQRLVTIEEHRKVKRKLMVFSLFRQVIDDVCALAGGAPRITGSTSTIERQRLIDQFTSDSSCDVLVSQVNAGELGINLQAAQVVHPGRK